MTMDFEGPSLTIHLHPIPGQLARLAFVPRRRERGVLSIRKEPGLMLYSHNVLIQGILHRLLPSWLSFVDGVVDSEDLPLEREPRDRANNRLMAQLGKESVKARVLRELEEAGENHPGEYAQFIEEFGPVLGRSIAGPVVR